MSGVGEFGLIDSLAARLERPGSGVGIGDDAAVWQTAPGCVTVGTTDMLIEGIHFRLDWTTPEDLGWKALAVNLSDLAAMGAWPGRALISVGLLANQTEIVERVYDGLADLARLTGTHVVGGDTVRTPGPLILNVALLGEAHPDRILHRGGARPGDLLLLSGPVGLAGGGLELLLGRDVATAGDAPGAGRLLAALHRPSPRLAVGRILADSGVRCAIDVSDGVASEAWHLAHASHVSIELDPRLLPVATEAVALFGEERARQMGLSGGEDYELLFTVPEARLAAVRSALAGECEPTVIGRVTGTHPTGSVASPGGVSLSTDKAGYVAF
jgi:thiamine-monophosphate kinase